MICCVKMNEGKPIVVVCANFWKNFCKNKNIWRNFKMGSNIFQEISSASLQTSLCRDLQVNTKCWKVNSSGLIAVYSLSWNLYFCGENFADFTIVTEITSDNISFLLIYVFLLPWRTVKCSLPAEKSQFVTPGAIIFHMRSNFSLWADNWDWLNQLDH